MAKAKGKVTARKPRTLKAIQADIDAALHDYHSKTGKMSDQERASHNGKVAALRAELGAYYSDGAKKCPSCGRIPHGMQKNPSTVEVGCLICEPFEGSVEHDGKKVPAVISVSARGRNREEAVDRWNAGPKQWVTTLNDGTKLNN